MSSFLYGGESGDGLRLGVFQMEVEALRRDLHMTRLALCSQVSFQCSGARHGDRPDDMVSGHSRGRSPDSTPCLPGRHGAAQ